MKTFPWFYGLITLVFGGLLAFSYLLVPNVPVGITVKVVLTILMALWVMNCLGMIAEDQRQREEIVAAQSRYFAKLTSRTPLTFGAHIVDPTTGHLSKVHSQDEVDTATLYAAYKNPRHRDLLKPELKFLLSMS